MRTARLLAAMLLPLLASCSNGDDELVSVGTLERDRAELRASAAEMVVARHVDDGEQVQRGDPLLQLDTRLATARLRQAQAELQAARAALAEIRRGARSERIDQARAALEAARSEQQAAASELQRQRKLDADGLTSEQQLEAARKAAGLAAANADQARAQLAELLNGATPEQLALAEAGAEAAAARVQELELLLAQLTVEAPFDGQVEQLLVEVGDRVATGALLATAYRSGPPHARILLPAAEKQSSRVGELRPLLVDGNGCYMARIRFISAQAEYTPYYALREQDRGRLVYRAELELPDTAAELPTGLPASLLRGTACEAE